LTLTPIEKEHALFRSPYLFAEAPAGFETQGTPQLKQADGILMSNYDFGCIWRGERRGRAAQRGELRDAHEWGANLIFWAAQERQERVKRKGVRA